MLEKRAGRHHAAGGQAAAHRPGARLLEDWIKYEAFGIDPKNPDPGRVTVRRLNRVEYRNTVRDLIGRRLRHPAEFPPDDTGHGFDNIGEVLTLSPLLLEKYLTAAKAVVSATVPTTSRTVAEQTIAGRRFRSTASATTDEARRRAAVVVVLPAGDGFEPDPGRASPAATSLSSI